MYLSRCFYVCVLVGVRSDLDPIPLYSIGEIHGKISTIGSGDGGFGYDKIFYPTAIVYQWLRLMLKKK